MKEFFNNILNSKESLASMLLVLLYIISSNIYILLLSQLNIIFSLLFVFNLIMIKTLIDYIKKENK